MSNPPFKISSQGYSLLTTIFGITAFILMWLGSLRCNFLKFESVVGSEPVTLQLGMWYYESWSFVASTSGSYVFESCHGYPDYTAIDATWKTARAFGIIAFILGIAMFVVACISACSTSTGQAMQTPVWEAPAYILTAICQGLTLLLLSSNACNSDTLVGLGGPAKNLLTFGETCSMSTGAKFIVSATAFWVAAGVVSFLANRAEKKEMTLGGDGEGLDEPLNSA